MAHDLAPSQRLEISVVVPLYDEEENVVELHRRLAAALEPLEVPYELVFVNDGSRDATAPLVDALHGDDPNLVVIHLSRNFGHQPALSAGLDRARGRGIVVMDGDLQDPPEIIPQLVAQWRAGHDVVYAVRRHRKEGMLKRLGYFSFYRILNAISDLDIPLDSGDFCLMDRKVVEALKRLPERARFVRGLRTFVGFRQTGLAYERAARGRGRPKYSLRALIGLAVDGLVSFSSYPLRLVTYLGIGTAAFAFVLMLWVFGDAFYHHTAPRGWASTVVVVLFMGAVQLISLGIIGEYVRLIFLEAKERPAYVVAQYKRRRRCSEPPCVPPSQGGKVCIENSSPLPLGDGQGEDSSYSPVRPHPSPLPEGEEVSCSAESKISARRAGVLRRARCFGPSLKLLHLRRDAGERTGWRRRRRAGRHVEWLVDPGQADR